MPPAGETLTASDLVRRLGALLREVTSDRPSDAVHAGIAELVSQPDHDPRLAGVAGAQRFAAMWSALASGSELPEDAWHGVVLPSVLAFSNPQHLKTHLELATSLWMTASTAMADSSPASAADDASVPEPRPEPDDTVGASVAAVAAPPSLSDTPATASTPARPRRIRHAVIAAVVIAVLAAATVWWAQAGRPDGERRLSAHPSVPTGGVTQPAAQSPQATGAQPTATPALPAGTSPEPAPLSTLPVPTPTWTGPGPVVAPTAPQGLAVTGITSNSIALSWQPPTDAGSGGIAYYRISRDGSDAGWTSRTSATVTGLAPETRYTFTVTAYNGGGAASPASSPVAATTQASQPPQATGPPQQPQRTGAPSSSGLLAVDPPRTPITIGDSFTVTGAGWPCGVPAKIRLHLGGKPIAIPETNAEGAFRTTIPVDSNRPGKPTVAVIGSSEPLTLTRGSWVLTAELVTTSSCAATAPQSIQIVFR